MKNPIYILGPCAIENWEMYLDSATKLTELMEANGTKREWYFKGSFDKANRSSIYSERGVGIDKGVEYFYKIKQKFPNIKLITDIHEAWQVNHLKEVIDVIQIPAFLCRQTDLLVECARNFKTINVKKGQWLKPAMTKNIYTKIKETNPTAEVWITERGSVFGYDQLIVDFSAVNELKNYFDKVIFDVTHSTQKYSGELITGGNRELGEKYFTAASIFGYDGVFAEVHPDPKFAISDNDSQFKLDDFIYYFELYH